MSLCFITCSSISYHVLITFLFPVFACIPGCHVEGVFLSRVSTPPTSTANHSHQIIPKKNIESQLSVHFVEAYSRLPPTHGANSTLQHDDPLDTSTINPVC